MTPEERVLWALDELRDAMAAVLARPSHVPEPAALLTISAAAQALGVSRSTATRWADDGRLRTVGGRKARRVPRAAIAELMEKAAPLVDQREAALEGGDRGSGRPRAA
jgi:excisionase family DNA binding protein